MAITKPDFDPLSERGPMGTWRSETMRPPTGAPALDLEPGGSEPHDPLMENRLAKLEAVVPTLATKADMEGVRADLHKMDASIVRWMIATVLTLFLGFAGLFFTMQSSINGALERSAKPATTAPSERATAQPIIIQLPAQPPPPGPAPIPAKP